MERSDHRLAAIMFTDIVGFARMLERDAPGSLELLSVQTRIVRETVTAYGGRVIKTVGDALLCEFPNTVSAVKCAYEIQETVAVHNEAEPDRPLRLRIGVHLGDIHFLQDDAVGDGITVVTRLQGVARPGRICMSQDVYQLVSGKVPFTIAHLGKVRLRSVTREVDAYEISVSAHAEVAVPGDELDEPEARPPDGVSASSVADDESRAHSVRARSGPAGVLAENLRRPEYADFNELKALVLQEIKKAGRRLSVEEIRRRLPEESPGADRALDALAEKGFLTRVHRDEGRSPYGPVPAGRKEIAPRRRAVHDEDDEDEKKSGWDRALREPGPAGGYDGLVEDYRDHAASVAAKEKAGFRAHLVSFLGVNGGLFFLWSMTTFPGFPWFLIPLLAWGIGLASHRAGVSDRVREARELDRSEGLTREQLRVYRKYAKNRSGWRSHLVSNGATSVFLVALNLITSPGFMWSLFPVFFMGVGVLTHFASYRAHEKRLLKRLGDLGARIGGILGGQAAAPRRGSERDIPAEGPAAEAEQVRRRLLATFASLPDGSPLGADFEPVLNNFVEQIVLLDRKNREIDEIVRGIPLAELERDLVILKKRRGEAGSEKVRTEYDRSIAEIRTQQASSSELRNEREILKLRLASSLNQLKQLEIDAARMRTVTSDQEPASVGMLRDKSRELSRYLDDLREGYRELE